jgi:hypothetical protein
LPGHDEGVLLQLAPEGTTPQLLATGLKRPAGLRVLPESSIRFLADRLRREGEWDGGTVFEWTPGEGIEVLVRSGFKKPHDLSLDALGATYLTADKQRDNGHPEQGVIGKAFSEDGVSLFATGLKEPQGLTVDPQGNLSVAESDRGRVLKFRAPLPPTLDPAPPAFTNEATLTLTGTTEPNTLLTVRGAAVVVPSQTEVSAQVTVRASPPRRHDRSGLLFQRVTLTNTGATPLAGPLALVLTSLTPPEVTLANENLLQVNGSPAVPVPLVGNLLRPGESARVGLKFRAPRETHHNITHTHQVWALRPITVSDVEGHFSFPITLSPNTETNLEIFATAALGLGLTSAPAKVSLLHDDRPPLVTLTRPAPEAFVRGSVEVAGEATETMRDGEAWRGVATPSCR